MTGSPVLNAIIFAAIGVLVFLAALAIAAKLAPFDVRKQIVEERNLAVAVLAGTVALAMGWIVAAAMH
jgi:putative membrane protein